MDIKEEVKVFVKSGWQYYNNGRIIIERVEKKYLNGNIEHSYLRINLKPIGIYELFRPDSTRALITQLLTNKIECGPQITFKY